HRDGHRSDAARHRRDVAGDLGGGEEVDVAADPATDLVDADVDHDGALPDHVRVDQSGLADGDDQDVRPARVRGEIPGADMADGHRGEVVEQQDRDRLADDLAVAD